ncbi:MAG: hypothetical protein AAGB26_09505 [Planctomycetota bacterium]
MSISDRIKLYKRVEVARNRPLITYITSGRPYAGGSVGSDAVGELSRQLSALPEECEELDLLIISNGGDPTVAWRIVSNIRERVKFLGVLVPQAAFSAATMIALGADEIVMHPFGNLGPIDSQISTAGGRGGRKRFGSEDLTATLELARKEICGSDPDHQNAMLEVFKIVCDEVDPLAIGFTSRSIQLTNKMAKKMLSFHMSETESDRIQEIVNALHQDFFDHGYPISLTEAKEIGLKAVPPDKAVGELLWDMWLKIETELQLRKPFSLMELVRNNPKCAALFGDTQQVLVPQGLTPDQVHGFVDQILANTAIVDIPPTSFDVTTGLMESPRLASRCYERGMVLAQRQPDLNVVLTPITEDSGWETVETS